MRGVPLRIEIGPRDVKAGQAVLVRRDTKAKETVPLAVPRRPRPGAPRRDPGRAPGPGPGLPRSEHPRGRRLRRFKDILENQRGFVRAPWCGGEACEARIKAETMATIRVIPLDDRQAATDKPCIGLRRQRPGPGLFRPLILKRGGPPVDSDRARERRLMTDTQIRARGVRDARVLAAVAKVPRHLFVPEALRVHAYADEPLPIGHGQTISQPYIVAYMTEALALRGGEKVLEIGTGSGYQTAVLAELAGEVWTVEIVEPLARQARAVLDALGYANIRYRLGDGSAGWPGEGPFDAIIVTAAAAVMPAALEEELGRGGRLIVPVGTDLQELYLVRRTVRGIERDRLLSVRFVPLVRAS